MTKSKKLWPVQAKPSKAIFEKWRRYIRSQYCKHGRTNKLKQTLGRWHQSHHEVEWPAYFDRDTETVMIKKDQGWHSFLVTGNGHTYQGGTVSNVTFDTVKSLPSSTIPIFHHDSTCDMPHQDYDFPLPVYRSPVPQFFSSTTPKKPREGPFGQEEKI